MTTTTSPHVLVMSPMCQTAASKCVRYMDLLDSDESRERVTVLTSRYQHMLPAEKLAFLQELVGPGGAPCPQTDALLRRVLETEEAACAVKDGVEHYTSPRLFAVQARDPTLVYVGDELPPCDDSEGHALVHVGTDDAHQTPSHTEKIAQILGEGGLFGERRVRLQSERLSMYDRIQRNKDARVSTVEAAALVTEETFDSAEGCGRNASHVSSADALSADPSSKTQQDLPHRADAGSGTRAASEDHTAPTFHRSHGYQTLRLAHSFPHHINTSPVNEDRIDSARVVNTSGIPIAEADLRRWFDSMDAERCGYLNCQEFLAWMRRLERDFGAQETYTQLEADCARLSQDNKLGYEAFAYLVLRFVRA